MMSSPSPSPVESAWEYLVIHSTEFQLASLGTFLLHETSSSSPASRPSSSTDSAYSPSTRSRKRVIHLITRSDMSCVLILYHVCVNLPLMILSYRTFEFMGLRSSLPLPHWRVVVSQVLFFFVLEDFIFCWGHRALHTKWLYQHIHSVHHEYATPFGLTSEYAHPAEILFLGLATVAGPALTGPHLFTLWVWMMLRVLETVEAHSGYDFPWSSSNFLPLYGG